MWLQIASAVPTVRYVDIHLPDSDLHGILGHPLVYGLLDRVSDGVLVIDVASRHIIHMNRRAQVLLGYADDEVHGCTCAEVARSPACRLSCPLEALLEDSESKGGELDLVYRNRADKLVHAHTRMVVIRGPDGAPLAGIEIFRDLTEVRDLEHALRERRSLAGIIGRSPAMQELYELIEQVAPYDLPVLITGESGVGKERVADALQGLSDRMDGPFIKVNCAALSPSLVESELFGHRRGAFTGASSDRRGRFEEADGGTILLDEVGELPLGIQAKLLRALQEGEIQRVGEDRPRRVDVRFLAATNRDVEDDVAKGHFRQDLYYRLAGVRVHVPPLRQRGADIPLLAAHFLDRFAQEAAARGRPKAVDGLDTEALLWMSRQRWPGNVRELENALRLAFIRTLVGARIGLPQISQSRQAAVEPAAATLADLERRAITSAMESSEGNVAAAARMLGVDRSTLWRKLKRLTV